MDNYWEFCGKGKQIKLWLSALGISTQVFFLKFRTTDGDTALMAAANSGHADCVEELIAAGANPNAQNQDGACVLYEAAAHGRHE